MLKHVSSGQLRRRSADMGSTGTLGSTGSDVSPASSVRSEPCGTGQRKAPIFTGVIKVHTGAVRSDMEYKTFIISSDTTSKDLVNMVLFKCKLRSRDPNLFAITMEIGIKKKGVPMRSMMLLEDEAKPLVLQACHPRGESRFHIQQKRGGLVKVNVSCLSPGSQYKSLLVSDRTSSLELIKLLLTAYKVCDDCKHYALHEVCSAGTAGQHIYERQLAPEDCPLLIQQSWTNPADFAFHLQRALPACSLTSHLHQRFPRRARRAVHSADMSNLYPRHLNPLDTSCTSSSTLLSTPRRTSMLSSMTSLASMPATSISSVPSTSMASIPSAAAVASMSPTTPHLPAQALNYSLVGVTSPPHHKPSSLSSSSMCSSSGGGGGGGWSSCSNNNSDASLPTTSRPNDNNDITPAASDSSSIHKAYSFMNINTQACIYV